MPVAAGGRVIRDDDDVSVFSGSVVDLLRLAEDEARMLGRSRVEPEHMLLASSRRGDGRDLLAQRGLAPRDVHAAIVQLYGDGDDLVLGRLPRSRRSSAVLDHVVAIAERRGQARPGDVEMLLALAADERAAAVLATAGVRDLALLVEQTHPSEREPLDSATMRHHLLAAAVDESPRSWRVPIPAFERFTSEARRMISAAAETAARLGHREVEPFHLLLGCLQVPASLGDQTLAGLWADDELGPADGSIDLARRLAPPPSHQPTGIFSDLARRVVAEDALALAYRHGHQHITTGHLLLAALDSRDPTIWRMSWPRTQQLARTLIAGLPGAEHEAGPDHELEWIAFDVLISTLTLAFRRVLPYGWTIRGSARSDIHLELPNTHSESDFQIRPGWVTSQPGSGRDRLQHVTEWMLERLQAAVTETTGRPWPSTINDKPAAAYAHVTPDRYNPRLQLGFGAPNAPVLTVVEPGILLHMLIHTS